MESSEWSAEDIKRNRERKQSEVRERVRKRWLSSVAASEFAEMFPARPKALRKIAFGLRQLSGSEGRGKLRPFTMDEWELAKHCQVSRRTLQRYLPVFEHYGVIEVHRWRYRRFGAMPNTYCLFLGTVIPEDWTFEGGRFNVSARQVAL